MKLKNIFIMILIYLFGYSNLPAYSIDAKFAPYDMNNDNVIDGYDWAYYTYSDKSDIIRLNYSYLYFMGNKKIPSANKITQDISFLIKFCDYLYSEQSNLNRSVGLVVGAYIFKANK